MNWEMELLEREMLGQPVRGLQYMLRRLSKVYSWLPEVVPDGIFGERTLEAVMEFQKRQYPPVTGVVDVGTWNAIRDAWLEAERVLAFPRQLRAFPHGEAVAIGQKKDVIYLTQAMFHSLSRVLEGIESGPINGIHGQSSVRNTRWLQSRAGLPVTGVMDQAVWDALSRLYELFVVRRPAAPLPEPGAELGRG